MGGRGRERRLSQTWAGLGTRAFGAIGNRTSQSRPNGTGKTNARSLPSGGAASCRAASPRPASGSSVPGRCDFQSRPVVCMERARVAAVVGRALRARRAAGEFLFWWAECIWAEVRSQESEGRPSRAAVSTQRTRRVGRKGTQRTAGEREGGRGERGGGAGRRTPPPQRPGGVGSPPPRGGGWNSLTAGAGVVGGRNGAWGAIGKGTSWRGGGKKCVV